jgi:replication initiation and membrane attachment protein
MKDVGLDDFYEVRVMGLVSDVDRLSLVDLYEPLIGARALAVYLTLLEDPTRLDGGLTLTHDKLFVKLLLSPGEFFKAMEALEATGLAKTFYKEGNGLHYFIYCLYSPKDPHEFFDDVLFVGTLKKYLGVEAVDALAKKYQTSRPVEGFRRRQQILRGFLRPRFR